MAQSKRLRCAVLLLALLPFSLGAQTVGEQDGPPDADPDSAGILAGPLPPADGEARIPLEEIRRYVGVYRTVRDAYVDEVSDAELMQAAIRGLLIDLDPHSAYLDRSQSESMEELSTGAYDGIGVELVLQPDRSLLVISPIDGTPAARAGIRPGDVIVAIDGESILSDNLDEAVTTLRGPPGSRVGLTVLREGEPEPLELTVVRETIRITSVSARMLEPGYGYLRLSVFQGDTAIELRRHLARLKTEAGDDGLKGLVLDLRSNPGGLLNAAVEAADAFLDAKALDSPIIVSTRGRQPFANSEYRAHSGDLLNAAPMVVLVDGGSASASEVLAGALRDHQRAVVIGERTFGKGSVQTVLPLDNGDAIKLTTARYYTPSGRSIQASGITPDILASNRPASSAHEGADWLRERDLPGHLEGENERPAEIDAERTGHLEGEGLPEALSAGAGETQGDIEGDIEGETLATRPKPRPGQPAVPSTDSDADRQAADAAPEAHGQHAATGQPQPEAETADDPAQSDYDPVLSKALSVLKAMVDPPAPAG
jgi:carboxyl-terminal processing protease